MMRAVRLAAIGAALLVAGPACAGDAGSGAREARVLTEINRVRAEHGLAPLSPDDRLARAARTQARDMARNDFLDHEGSDGSRPASRVTRAGYRWRAIAENIAAGQSTALRAVRAWMASPGHRRNILNPEMRHAGVGHVFLADDGGRLNYRHYWAMLFGRARR